MRIRTTHPGADAASRRTPSRPSAIPIRRNGVLCDPGKGPASNMLIKNVAIERLVMAMHGLREEDGRPLAGRLAHLRRFDFPSPRPKGAGLKTPYEFEDALRMLAAFEMMQGALGSGEAAQFLSEEWAVVRELIAHGWARLEKRSGGTRLVMAVRGTGISSLDEPSEPTAEIIGLLAPEGVAALLAEPLPIRNLLLFDLESFIGRVGEAFPGSGAGSRREFDEEMTILCRQTFASDEPSTWVVEPTTVDAARRMADA